MSLSAITTTTTTTNRFLLRRENSQQSYDDGSFYSDTNSLQSHQDSFYEDDEHPDSNISEKKLFFMDQRYRNCGDIFEGSDYCSTCPSEDYYTDSLSDSDDEDAAQKWPWISHIQNNGNLVFVHTHHQHRHHTHHHHHNHNNHQHHQKTRSKSFINTQNNKDNKGLHGKLKSAIKKSRSLTKKDVIDKNIDISKYKLNHKKKQDNAITDTKTEIQTITNDGVHLLCKNMLLHLHDKVQESFANLENVIGVISGLDLDPVLDDFHDSILMNGNNTKYSSNDIIVQGIIPNSPAGESEINIGDIILAINGIKVNLQTVNSIVEKINGTPEIVVTVERVAPVLEPDKPSELCSIVSNNMEMDSFSDVFYAHQENCMVSLLTLNSNEDETDGDILFWYPKSDQNSILRNTRGIFLTLSDMLDDVMNEPVQSSVLYTSNEQINVTYTKCDGDVLVLAVPDQKCDQMNLLRHTKEFVGFLTLLNGDVKRAFRQENIDSTTHIAALFLDLLLQKKSVVPFGTIRQLQLSTKHNVEISSILSDVEAADYGECVDDFFPHQRLYTTIGTCLFYKDNLVCSHLTEENLQQVVLFCKYHWLFLLSKAEKMKQLVVWKEIFARKRKEDEDYGTPENTRWFLLVVGQGHSLFCSLLETGGAASAPEGNPGPHPYYVDTSWSTLTYLIESVGLETMSHSRLEGPSLPSVIQPSEAINPKTSNSPRAIELIKRKVPVPRDPLDLTNTLSNESDLHGNMVMGRERSQSRLSNLSANSTNRYHHNEISSHFKHLSILSSTEISSTAALSTKLSAGSRNSLFYFTLLSKNSGIFVSPNPSKRMNSKVTDDILHSYTNACHKIHTWFTKQKYVSQSLEQGVLFDLQLTKGAEMKKGFPNIRYWVVGRQSKKGKMLDEVYVCFQDGTPQNVIEMAFKIRFGCHY